MSLNVPSFDRISSKYRCTPGVAPSPGLGAKAFERWVSASICVHAFSPLDLAAFKSSLSFSQNRRRSAPVFSSLRAGGFLVLASSAFVLESVFANSGVAVPDFCEGALLLPVSLSAASFPPVSRAWSLASISDTSAASFFPFGSSPIPRATFAAARKFVRQLSGRCASSAAALAAAASDALRAAFWANVSDFAGS